MAEALWNGAKLASTYRIRDCGGRCVFPADAVNFEYLSPAGKAGRAGLPAIPAKARLRWPPCGCQLKIPHDRFRFLCQAFPLLGGAQRRRCSQLGPHAKVVESLEGRHDTRLRASSLKGPIHAAGCPY